VELFINVFELLCDISINITKNKLKKQKKLSYIHSDRENTKFKMSFKDILNLDEHTAPWWEDPICDILQLDDGNIACSTSAAHVTIWCPNTGSLIKEIEFNIGSIHRMALLNIGLLACGGNDGSLVVCHPTTGLVEMELEGHDGYIRSLYTLGDRLVSYSYGNIKIWNSSGQLQQEIDADVRSGTDLGELIVLSNKQFLLTGDRGPIWDLSGSGWDKELGFNIGEKFYCDKNRILGVDDLDQLYILNSENLGKTIISREANSVTKIASLNDGRIITGHENGFVKIWDAKGFGTHLSIEMFDDRMIDNFLVMKDNRILTIACEHGKIWSI
jgi:WD40 repeat protein